MGMLYLDSYKRYVSHVKPIIVTHMYLQQTRSRHRQSTNLNIKVNFQNIIKWNGTDNVNVFCMS